MMQKRGVNVLSPTPLTYQLYCKYMTAVNVQNEKERMAKVAKSRKQKRLERALLLAKEYWELVKKPDLTL